MYNKVNVSVFFVLIIKGFCLIILINVVRFIDSLRLCREKIIFNVVIKELDVVFDVNIFLKSLK